MTDLRVAIPWWTPRTVGGSQQAIRGNVKGFIDAGCDVDLYIVTGGGELVELAERASEYDLVLWPFLDNSMGTEPGETHVHEVVGGFGAPDLPDERVAQTFADADSISFLDPLLAEHFADRVDVDLGEAHFLLNPPNRGLFGGDGLLEGWIVDCPDCDFARDYEWRQSAGAARGGHVSNSGHDPAVLEGPRLVDGGAGRVLVPKIGNEYKTGQALSVIAAQAPDVIFETSVVQPVGMEAVGSPDLPPNVVVRPGVPYTAMPGRYARSSIVLNVAEREAGPNVAYEAWLADRPFCCTPEGMGYHKRLPAVAVDAGDIGAPMDWWFDKRGGYVGAGEGEHYVSAAPAELADTVRGLLADEVRRAELVAGGRRWLEQLDGYDWQARAEAILDIAGLV